MSGYWYVVDASRAANDQVWFRYRQEEDGEAKVRIYTAAGALVKTIDGLGDRPAGVYDSRSRAIFWDTKNTGGTPQGTGVYNAILDIDSVDFDTIKFTLP